MNAEAQETTQTKPKTVSPQTAYYHRNREAILAKEKEKKRWLKYYEENKQAIALRRITLKGIK